jgi:DNA-binding NtrC family response regulator
VRELRNIMERALLMADGDTLLPEHLPPEVGTHPPPAPVVDEIVPLATAELRYLQWALAHHDGDRKSLADKLGISERTLYRKLADHPHARRSGFDP